MRLDTRARGAAQGIRRAVEVMEMSTSTKQRGSIERFDGFRDRKQRNRRIGAIVVAAALMVTGIVIASTRVLDRGQVIVPADPDLSPPPMTSVATPELGTLTLSEAGCAVDATIERHLGALTAVNEDDRVLAFEVTRFVSTDLTYAQLEAHVDRERRLAEAGRPNLGPPPGAKVLVQREVRPGGSVTLDEIAPGRYAIVCLRLFDDGAGMRPFALAGPVVFD